MLKKVRKFVNGKYVTEMIEIEETVPQERELTESERLAALEERQDISEAALEELIFMMMGGA